MNKISAVFVCLVCTVSAYADFNGLDGLRFGQVVDLTKYQIRVPALETKEITVTNTTFNPFVEWTVDITPKTYKVVRLMSTKVFASQQKAEQERDRLVEFFRTSIDNAACQKRDEIETHILGLDATGGVVRAVAVFQEKNDVAVLMEDLKERARAKMEANEIAKSRMPQPGYPKFSGLFGVDFLRPVPEEAFLEKIDEGGNKEYSLKLKKPFYGITECTMMVTRKRGLVWTITAEAEYASLEDAKKAKLEMVAAIEKKYGIRSEDEGRATVFNYNPMPQSNVMFSQRVMVSVSPRKDKDKFCVFIWAIDIKGAAIMRAEGRQKKGKGEK